MPRKKTTEEYIQECKSKGLDLPIEDYVNTKTKIKHKCNKCGNIYKQTPHNHLQGQGCPKCGGTKKKTPEEYYKECKSKGLDLPIEDYKGSNIKIKHKCPKGHIYKQNPGNHLQGDGCLLCKINKMKKTSEEYYNRCKEKSLDLPIEDYKGNSIKIKHRCSKNHIYEQTPNHHLHGNGCPKCNNIKKSKKYSKTPEEYYQECKSKGLDLPVEDYINNKTKIKHICSKGHIYEQAPDMHINDIGCPICNESHGERYIRNYLNKNDISYIPQKTFEDLKDKTYLSYDFYLPDYNILIEYQGIQHYKSFDYFGGDNKFKNQQYHDNLKREYAKNNGYKLLELHYSLDSQDKVNRYLDRRIKG